MNGQWLCETHAATNLSHVGMVCTLMPWHTDRMVGVDVSMLFLFWAEMSGYDLMWGYSVSAYVSVCRVDEAYVSVCRVDEAYPLEELSVWQRQCRNPSTKSDSPIHPFRFFAVGHIPETKSPLQHP